MTATAWRADAGTSGEQASVGVGRTVRRCGGVLAVLLVARALIAAPSRADIPAGRAAYDAGDYAKAYAEFSALARQGNAIAQYELGNMYRLGRGVAQDEAEAARRYRRAAAQGDAPSQFWLGLMYQLGKGVPKVSIATENFPLLSIENFSL